MTVIDPYLKRRTARVGDVIESRGGQLYRVDEVHLTPGGRAYLYGVTGIANALPNAFYPVEVVGVLRWSEALDALAQLEEKTAPASVTAAAEGTSYTLLAASKREDVR
jgi:hypothetical protein